MFKRQLLLVMAAAATVAGLAGCAATTTSGGGAASSDVPAAYLKSVQQSVDAAKAPQKALTVPANKAVTGKRIAIVSVTLAETGALRTARALATAAKDIGWASSTYDGQGSPTTANAKLQQAVTTKPDGIVLVSLDPTDVASGLSAANAAKIPVTCAACWDLTAKDTIGTKYTDVEPSIGVFQNLGYLTAQYAYLRTKGHPKFLFMNDPALSNLSARQAGYERFMKECSAAKADCNTVGRKDFQVANATTTLSADAASLAQANPSFNAFWMTFDFAGLQALNGLRQAGIATPSATSFMVASNGDGPNLNIIRQGGYIKTTVAISFEQEAYAAIDNLNRTLAGRPRIKENVPVRLFDKSNAAQAKNGNWDGDIDYRAAYMKAWQG